MILTQGETIHEQGGRIEALETALAKAVAALIFYGEDPGEPLRGNGDTARQALAAIRAALAGLPRAEMVSSNP